MSNFARKLCTIAFVFLSVMSVSLTATAANLTFYAGNDCAWEIVCQFDMRFVSSYGTIDLTNPPLKSGIASSDGWCIKEANNVIRSMSLDAGVSFSNVEVFDSPNAYAADATVLHFKDLKESVCVQSFNTLKTYGNKAVLVRPASREVDGKISAIIVSR